MTNPMQSPKSRTRLITAMAVCAGLCIALAVWANDTSLPESTRKHSFHPPIPSRFDPAKAFTLTHEQRWQLDFDLVNEADMRELNSRRFEVPNPSEKRALWFEEMAQGYLLADLINRLHDFRIASMVHDEKAFAELYELGKSGNEAAACMAEHFHRRLNQEITARWAVTYHQIALAAAPFVNSKHPVCSEVERSLYLQGEGGLPKDLARAQRAFLKPAVAGFFMWQSALSAAHPDEVDQMNPKAVEAFLCWKRFEDQSSAHSGFKNFCEGYRSGITSDVNGKSINVPASIQRLANQWCEPSRSITSQNCAELESQITSQGN